MPGREFREVRVAAIGDRRGEILPVLLLEHEQGGGMVRAQALKVGHRGRLRDGGAAARVVNLGPIDGRTPHDLA
ncbi:hypothetical protein CS0771_56520 [Catellatospora sp. IY07-71]|nr:hypothetical protein CS0771_56520 [Catellatospora sp. IY07-71]